MLGSIASRKDAKKKAQKRKKDSWKLGQPNCSKIAHTSEKGKRLKR